MNTKRNTICAIVGAALVVLTVPGYSVPTEAEGAEGGWTAFKRTEGSLEIIETDRRGALKLAKEGYEVERTSTYQLTGVGTADSGESSDEEILHAPAPPEAAPTGARVAVVDSGVNAKHPWLMNNIVAVGDLTGVMENPWGSSAIKEDPDKDEKWFDGHGHGTHVAGIIRQNYPSVQIVVAKALNDFGDANDPWIARAITWAVDMDVDVINLSLGGISNSRVLREAVDLAVSKGIIVVAAAGNYGHDGSPTFYPAAWPGVVAVAAVDETGEATYFSNRGDYVDIAAEGDKIVSASRTGGLVKLSGTSMAAPKVAAVLAKIRAEKPDWSAQQVIDHALGTAKDAGEPGPDPIYGYGILDPERATDTSEAKTPAGKVVLAKAAFRLSTKHGTLTMSDSGGSVAQLRVSYMYGRHELPASVPLNLTLNCFCFGPQDPKWSVPFKEQTTFVLRAFDSQGAPYLPVSVRVSPSGKISILKFPVKGS
ncbi:MAG: S8 family serine peptidase [Chloroflexi bacterium]|nr:S8 family serine peptidase [Chloroflexota bacterium]